MSGVMKSKSRGDSVNDPMTKEGTQSGLVSQVSRKERKVFPLYRMVRRTHSRIMRVRRRMVEREGGSDASASSAHMSRTGSWEFSGEDKGATRKVVQ